MLGTTGVLLVGCVAVFFGALLRGSAAALGNTEALLFAGAALAVSLARRQGRR